MQPLPSFIAELSLSEIVPHVDHVPREARTTGDKLLLDAIRRFGLLHPLIVFPVNAKRYRILDGHRRYLCARQLTLEYVPCRILPSMDDAEYETRRYLIHETVHPWAQVDESAWKDKLDSLQAILSA